MAIVGTYTDKNNPEYTIDDFCFWIPKMAKFMKTDEGLRYFNKLYPIANNKVFYSVFCSDWEYAISLVIAHYATLIGRQLTRPSGDTLEDATSGSEVQGVLTNVSVGGFSKSYDFDSIVKSSTDEAMFWNQTSYGISFYALMKSKSLPNIMVVTNGNPYENRRNNTRKKPWEMF